MPQKYQWNLKWTGSSCVFVLTPEKHYRKPGKGKKEESFGLVGGIELGETLAALGGLPCSPGDYTKINSIRGDSGWGPSFCTQGQDEVRGEQ